MWCKPLIKALSCILGQNTFGADLGFQCFLSKKILLYSACIDYPFAINHFHVYIFPVFIYPYLSLFHINVYVCVCVLLK